MTHLSASGDLLPRSWTCVHEVHRPARPARLVAPSDLPLGPIPRGFLDAVVPNGIYEHQHRAIELALRGQHVCLTTGTASGKTLAFQALALHHLGRDPEARVLAIYPQKSLGFEQEGRWRAALAAAGMPDTVVRIDGSVAVGSRSGLVKKARVLIVTPDIIHAWLLGNLADKAVRGVLRSLALVIVDEVHTYSGVFGSNSAFLFRRLRHAASQLGASPQFFCASATIREPDRHVAALCGVDCTLVGDDVDSSPRQTVSIALVEPPEGEDFLAQLTVLLRQVLEKSDHRFVAFVDSRKQAEHIATILNRREAKAPPEEQGDASEGQDEAADPDGESEDGTDLDDLAGAELERAVLPYRAGYEETDRVRIQKRLTSGELRGVISTSALELGIDIPHLDLAILVGVPRSATSLTQRIGRVGRQKPGHALVVNSRDPFDSALFRDPQRVLDRPLAESTLYLENVRIQHIHALCLARTGGEHDAVSGGGDAEFTTSIAWPEGFVARCVAERTGQVEPELQTLSLEAGDSPQHTFPLRDVERQFDVEWKTGPTTNKMGSLSFAQVMREAYPGALYLYMASPYRVYNISLTSRKVWVRRAKFHPTRPTTLPTLVFPNVTAGNVHRSERRGDLTLLECQLQVREAIAGFEERKGQNRTQVPYPVDGKLHASRVTWKAKRFARNYFTSGVVLAHPSLGVPGVQLTKLAGLLIDAVLMVIPFDRQDIGAACDKFRGESSALSKEQRFLAIYDQTYGSLRLSSRVLERDLLPKVLNALVELVEGDEELSTPSPTVGAVRALARDAAVDPERLPADPHVFPGPPTGTLRVVMPGSIALNAMAANSEFKVESVFFSPKLEGPAYRAISLGGNGTGQVETWPVDAFVGIPGVTLFGAYDPDTGEVSQADPLLTPTADLNEEEYD